MKPLLLLDIDGVLNLLPREVSRTWNDNAGIYDPGHAVYAPIEREHTRFHVPAEGGLKMAVRVPTDTVALVERLAERFEVVWFTMWNGSARDEFAPMVGLPEFEHYHVSWIWGQHVLEDEGYTREQMRSLWVAKTPLIPGYVGDRPFVWIDDDSTPRDTAYLAAKEGLGDFLLITVEAHEGLTETAVDTALDWAKALEEVEAA